MTKDQLRRRYIVTTPDVVSQILKDAFLNDDREGRINDDEEDIFIAGFTARNFPFPTIELAWQAYKAYHAELERFEPVRHE